MNILIAEDKAEIANLVKIFLQKEGLSVTWAKDGQEALDYMLSDTKFELCIFDIMMPKIDGLSLIQQVREFSNLPIILLTAKNLEEDKVLGLDLGADDYITKPFSSLELVSRVKAQLRRSYSMNSSTLEKYGELVVDKEKCTVFKNGNDCQLTATEYKLLLKFIASPERVFTKEQLYSSVMGDFFDGDESTIVVHISKLRDKIEDNSKDPQYIKTIRGLGYKIEKR